MKIDMSPAIITLRLKEVNNLRKICLSLAKSSAGLEIRKKHLNNELVRRTFYAIGL